MLYSLEIYPESNKEVPTYFFTVDYLTWSRKLNDILTSLHSKESKSAKKLTQKIIINRIKKGGPSLYQFKIKGNSIVTLCTEGITSEQFKEFIIRQSNYMQLRIKNNKVDELSLFLEWCRYNDFTVQSFQNLMVSFQNNDYSLLLSKYDIPEELNQINKWIYPTEKRSFMEYRVNLLKELLKTEIEKKIALVYK